MKNVFKTLLGIVSLLLILVSFCSAAHLTCDPENTAVIDKYTLVIDDVTIEILGPEGIKKEDNTIRLMYDVSALSDGEHVAKVKAGNERGDWSDWSNTLAFYLGVPKTIKLYYVPSVLGKLSRENWKVLRTSSFEPKMGGELAIDGNTDTRWHSNWTTTDPDTKHPHEIQVDLGGARNISGFYILPRQDSSWNGTVANYKFYISIDGLYWTEVASGKLNKVKTEQFVGFKQVTAKYFSLVALSEVNGGPWTTIAEFNILGY